MRTAFLTLLELPLAGSVALASPAGATTADCLSSFDPANASIARRKLEPVDLVRLRDIGSLPDFTGAPIFAVSPDRSRIAVQLRQADPAANTHCLAMMIFSLDGTSRPQLVDQGGELIRWRFPELAGKADFPTGFAKVITPRWLPDGKSIAFLKRLGGVTQVWQASVDGSGSAPLTRSPIDVVDFLIVEDGRGITYSTKPALKIAWQAIEEEGRQGFHYDDRFSPDVSSRPFPAPPIASAMVHLDLVTGTARAATSAEGALLQENSDFRSEEGVSVAPSGKGWKARTRSASDGQWPPPLHLFVENPDGRELACKDSACAGNISIIGWSQSGDRVRYLLREGRADSLTAVYEWAPGKTAPKRLYATEGVLLGCQPYDDDLICVQEASTQPRRIVRLKLASGTVEPLFDPNPGFDRLELGRVERLRWKTSFGVEGFSDLVYPTDYVPGRRYPLLVVQYQTRGFLRGGTGDENPIQAYANRGYFVLSMNRPQSPARVRDAQGPADFDKADLVGFVDRRNVLSAIEIAIGKLIDRGLVDRMRIGLTGLSDGASTVQYAALHSDLFAVASISGCCWEPGQAAQLGPATVRQFAKTGWPRITEKADEFWNQISWVRNAARVKMPILLQMADSEFRSTLRSYTALEEAGGSADMYVFPDETHVKWQPAHRLAIYERNLAWFDFWLKGASQGLASRQKEIARWEVLRSRREQRSGSSVVKVPSDRPPDQQRD